MGFDFSHFHTQSNEVGREMLAVLLARLVASWHANKTAVLD